MKVLFSIKSVLNQIINFVHNFKAHFSWKRVINFIPELVFLIFLFYELQKILFNRNNKTRLVFISINKVSLELGRVRFEWNSSEKQLSFQPDN